jgi:hypothetical protein
MVSSSYLLSLQLSRSLFVYSPFLTSISIIVLLAISVPYNEGNGVIMGEGGFLSA